MSISAAERLPTEVHFRIARTMLPDARRAETLTQGPFQKNSCLTRKEDPSLPLHHWTSLTTLVQSRCCTKMSNSWKLEN